ncbi:hypothetical protein ACXET9_05950 [Brachybacterium sp. DNPG3]
MSSTPGPYPPAPGPSSGPGSGPGSPAPGSWTPAPAEAPRSRKGLYIGLGIGCGGLLLIGIVIIALVLFLTLRGSSGTATGGGGGEETTPAATPEEQATALVTEYMAALEAGDSATALELLGPDDATVLSTTAYDAALAAAPVADVVIDAPVMSTASGTVTAEYTVGGTPAMQEFLVSDYDADDVYELEPMYTYEKVPASLSGLGLSLAGEAVEDGDSLYLLPGSYELGVGNEYFTLDPAEPLVVLSANDVGDWPEAALTDSGLEAFRGAVQSAVDECIAMTTLTSGCGLDPISPAEDSNGIIAEEGTVARVLSDDAQRTIDTMVPTPSYDEPTYVQGQSIGSVDTTMNCTQDGVAGTCSLWWGNTISAPSVDMADPELPVTWS